MGLILLRELIHWQKKENSAPFSTAPNHRVLFPKVLRKLPLLSHICYFSFRSVLFCFENWGLNNYTEAPDCIRGDVIPTFVTEEPWIHNQPAGRLSTLVPKASTGRGTRFLRKFPSISGAIYKTQEQLQGGKYNHSSNYYEWSDQTPCKASLFFILETSLSLENILIF